MTFSYLITSKSCVSIVRGTWWKINWIAMAGVWRWNWSISRHVMPFDVTSPIDQCLWKPAIITEGYTHTSSFAMRLLFCRETFVIITLINWPCCVLLGLLPWAAGFTTTGCVIYDNSFSRQTCIGIPVFNCVSEYRNSLKVSIPTCGIVNRCCTRFSVQFNSTYLFIATEGILI